MKSNSYSDPHFHAFLLPILPFSCSPLLSFEHAQAVGLGCTESRAPSSFDHTIRAPLPRTLSTLPLSGAPMPCCFGPFPVQIPVLPCSILYFRWEVALFLRYHFQVSGGMASSGTLPCLALQGIAVPCFGQICFGCISRVLLRFLMTCFFYFSGIFGFLGSCVFHLSI